MKGIYNSRTFWATLLCSAVFASGFGLYIGLQQSIWFDEAYSISVAEHSWSEIVHLTSQDVHPPVYYWVLKAWMMLFGSSELALRSMSALFLGASIFVAGLLLRKFFGSKTALITLPFLVLAPFLLRYGFEIRMYSFVSFIGVGATYLLVLAVEEAHRKKRLLLFFLYALLVALGVYTLYFTALIWIAHLVWLSWLAYSQRRLNIVGYGIVAYAFAGLLFLPWLPIFLSSAEADSLSPVTHHLDIENLYGILTFSFLYQPSWEVVGFGVFIMALIVAMIGYLFYKAVKNASKSEHRYLALLAMYFMAPILTLVVVTYFKPIYIERYVAHFAIAMYMSLGVVVSLALRNANKLVYAATGGLAAILLFGCVQLIQTGNYNYQRLHKPTVKNIAMLLSECKNGAVIFSDGPQIAVELGYYVKDCPVYFFNETFEMGGGFAILDKSSLRVADASELPKTDTILHVYYDEPKRAIPDSFAHENSTTIDALSVATYQAVGK